MNRKGNIQTLYPTILALILVGVLMGAGLMILGQFKGTMSNQTSTEALAVGSTITALGTLASTWLPVIVVVIAAGIVLGILLGAFGGGKRK